MTFSPTWLKRIITCTRDFLMLILRQKNKLRRSIVKAWALHNRNPCKCKRLGERMLPQRSPQDLLILKDFNHRKKKAYPPFICSKIYSPNRRMGNRIVTFSRRWERINWKTTAQVLQRRHCCLRSYQALQVASELSFLIHAQPCFWRCVWRHVRRRVIFLQYDWLKF